MTELTDQLRDPTWAYEMDAFGRFELIREIPELAMRKAADEIDRLTARVAELTERDALNVETIAILGLQMSRLTTRLEAATGALRDARDNGLIYWEPNTRRGHEQKALMLARIDDSFRQIGEQAGEGG